MLFAQFLVQLFTQLFMMQNLILKLNLFENLNFVKFVIQNFIGG